LNRGKGSDSPTGDDPSETVGENAISMPDVALQTGPTQTRRLTMTDPILASGSESVSPAPGGRGFYRISPANPGDHLVLDAFRDQRLVADLISVPAIRKHSAHLHSNRLRPGHHGLQGGGVGRVAQVAGSWRDAVILNKPRAISLEGLLAAGIRR
jgi:hypothetical protein